MGNQREVAGVDLDRCGVHAFGEEALKLRRDRAVLPGDGIPGRFRPPGCHCGLLAEKRLRDASLHRVEHARPDRVDAISEVGQEGVLGEPPEAAGIDKPGVSRWCRELLGERGVVLAGVGGASRDVDHARNARVDSGLGDHGAREGMTGQDHRPVVQRQDTAGVRYVIGQRDQRVLHRGGG
jgi:hypothetical protein